MQFPDINPSRRVVVFGNYGDGNIGDEAMLQVIIDQLSLQKVSKIIVPSRAPDNLKLWHSSKVLYPVGILLGALHAMFADAVIIGGGTLFSRYSGKGIYPMLLIAIFRKIFTTRKTYFYGIGYSSTTPDLLRRLAILAFKVADRVYVRDSLSFKLLETVVPTRKLVLNGEIAIALSDEAADTHLPDLVYKKRSAFRTLIGFSLLYTFSKDDDKMILAVTEFIKNLSSRYDVGFVFLTFNPALINKQGIRKSDEIAGKVIVQSLPEAIASRCVVLPLYPVNTTVKIISQLDYVISMRYHCLVFAYMKNKPYLAISFDDKHSAFIQDFGGDMIELTRISSDELVSRWEAIQRLGGKSQVQ